MSRNKKKGQARKPAPSASPKDFPKARKDAVGPLVWERAYELAQGRTGRVRMTPSGDVVVVNPNDA